MKLYLFSRRPRLLGVILAGAALVPALASGAPAQAAALSPTGACDNSVLTQPFTHWGDSSSYKLVPGGSFEVGSPAWTLSNGARVVAGNEPYGASGSAGKSSLYLPAGASAQSPVTCVNYAYPTFRFFARNDWLLSTLLVQVVYNGVALPVGVTALSGSWQPTLPMLTLSAIPGLLDGGTTPVALRFTALLGGSHIDDVFVDPRMHH
ncbi:MAG: hypothetical protein WCB67_13155 [Solirubrobacteraceae bacterium]